MTKTDRKERKPRKIEKSEVFEYLKLPAGLLEMQNINALEKMILADIAYLGAKNGYRVGNKEMAQKLGAKHRTIVYALQRLKGFGYTTDSGPNKSHRCLAVGKTIAALFETKHKTKARANIALTKEPVNTDQESEPLRLAGLLLSEIQKRKPDFRKPNLQGWERDIDLMTRLDKRKPERIAAVIRWAQADNGNGSSNWDGWQNNILSGKALRKHFDRLELGMDKDNGTPKVSRGFAESSAIGTEVQM